MIKTKIFFEGLDDPNIDKQINRWLAKHPDIIVVDIKLQSNVADSSDCRFVTRDALVIYREYENV
ncbi:sporulation protein Cse60 [Limosilactobacillus mucosae]